MCHLEVQGLHNGMHACTKEAGRGGEGVWVAFKFDGSWHACADNRVKGDAFRSIVGGWGGGREGFRCRVVNTFQGNEAAGMTTLQQERLTR